AVTGLAAPGLRVDRGNLDVDRTRQDHLATLRAQGDALDLTVRARGGWQAAGQWAGTLQQLENRGQYPVALDAPVAVEAGARYLQLGKLAVGVAGGRIDMAGFRYDAGRLASQ